MFQIKSYLQYKNTLGGKSRVLREGVDYNLIYLNTLYLTDKNIFRGCHSGLETLIQVEGEMVEVANLSDCRPLLTVHLDYYSREGVKTTQYTEGDVLVGKPSKRRPFTPFKGIVYFNQYFELAIDNQVHNKIFPLGSFGDNIPEVQNQGSFFTDPAKYSKLLWNCTEDEGWQKVFELLEID